jgi:hypothetical protein
VCAAVCVRILAGAGSKLAGARGTRGHMPWRPHGSSFIGQTREGALPLPWMLEASRAANPLNIKRLVRIDARDPTFHASVAAWGWTLQDGPEGGKGLKVTL